MLRKLKLTPSRNLNYRKGQVQAGDRYISIRSEEQLQIANHLLTSNDNVPSTESPATRLERQSKLRSMRVRSTTEDGEELNDKVCAFRKGLAPAASMRQPVKVLYSCPDPTANGKLKRSRRYIEKSPERILDAPGIADDFYTSLTDWSYSNIVAVALGQAVYLWDADKGEANLLVEFDENSPFPTLVKWSQEGKYLSVGLSDGRLKIYDVQKKACLRTISVQMHRMACAGWLRDGVITCGTRAGRIYHHDVRERNSLIGVFDAHSSEVCGLRWSDDERYLTSGGADSKVNVWERTQISSFSPSTLWKFNGHTASVKAIAYVPFLGLGSNVVATGGGSNDHTVRIWNLANGNAMSCQDTFSQVTSILFNKSYKEMITGHGNPSSGVRVWRYASGKGFEHIADLKSHGGRILGLCQNPDGSYVMATGEDETMRLWCCWKAEEESSSQSSQNSIDSQSQSLVSDLSSMSSAFRIR